MVQAGTVLVEIDPADYQVAYERAKADFEDAQAAAVAAGVNVPITSVNTDSQVSSIGSGREQRARRHPGGADSSSRRPRRNCSRPKPMT